MRRARRGAQAAPRALQAPRPARVCGGTAIEAAHAARSRERRDSGDPGARPAFLLVSYRPYPVLRGDGFGARGAGGGQCGGAARARDSRHRGARVRGREEGRVSPQAQSRWRRRGRRAGRRTARRRRAGKRCRPRCTRLTASGLACTARAGSRMARTRCARRDPARAASHGRRTVGRGSGGTAPGDARGADRACHSACGAAARHRCCRSPASSPRPARTSWTQPTKSSKRPTRSPT